MAPTDTDELGPVDYVVVEFPAATSNFTGEMAAEPDKLVTAGTIRILDLIGGRAASPTCWRPTGKEPDMPIGRMRVGRRGVVGAPVARTAAVVGTAAVVAHEVERRHDRREDRRDDCEDRRDDRRDRR
jgi:hypothetical protein